MILTSGELIEHMEATPVEDWPAPRGYGYRGATGEKIKAWHIAVVTEFMDRMAGGDHRPSIDEPADTGNAATGSTEET